MIIEKILEKNNRVLDTYKFNSSIGRIKTPSELVVKMISLLPEKLFISNDTKFLDPCAGTGTFIIEILKKLLKYKTFDIAIKQIYICEISRPLSNAFLCDFLPKTKICNISNNHFNLSKSKEVNEYFDLFINTISDGRVTTFSDLHYIIYSESIKNEINRMILNLTSFIERYEKISKLESKLFGEVFTPKKLIEEMLNTFPKEIWSNKNLKWLDPAVGIGNFPSVIVEKLMEGLSEEIPSDSDRYKWIMEEMIYMCDISTKNLFLLYKLFDDGNNLKLNVHRGSFLESGFNETMKNEWKLEGFDVVVGNPPYLKGIWVKFFKKMLPLTKYAVVISPDGTKNLSKVSENLISLLQDNNIQSLTDHTNYFNVSSGKLVTYYFNKYLDTNLEAHLDNSLSQNIINKIIKSSTNKLEAKLSNNRSKIFNSQEKKDEVNFEFLIKIVENVKKDGLVYKFLSNTNKLNNNIIKYNLSEWFITNRYLGKSNNPSIYSIDDICSIGSNITIIKKWSTGNLENFKFTYSRKLFRFVLDRLRNGMFDTSPRHINMLPKMDLSKKWTDDELYKHFNLTQEEIDLIEKQFN